MGSILTRTLLEFKMFNFFLLLGVLDCFDDMRCEIRHIICNDSNMQEKRRKKCLITLLVVTTYYIGHVFLFYTFIYVSILYIPSQISLFCKSPKSKYDEN